MNRSMFVVIFLICLSVIVNAQFKNDLDNKDNVLDAFSRPETPSNLILGFINPENFSMKHSYSLIYSSFGANSIGLGIYTNSMSYKFTDNLNAKLDVSLVHSPFSSFSKDMTDKINGIYISRAEFNYKPFDNVLIQFRYRQLPSYGYNGYSQYGYMNSSRFSGYDPFFGDDNFPSR